METKHRRKRKQLLRETTPAVDAIARLNLSGDIIPHSWAKRIRTEEGRPYPKAVLILANIVYWHRPVEIIDEKTGDLVGYRRKFSGQKFQLRARMYDNLFGFSKRETLAAINRLATMGLIEKDLVKSIIINGAHYGNVLYVTPLAKAIEAITYDEDDEEAKAAEAPDADDAPGNAGSAASATSDAATTREAPRSPAIVDDYPPVTVQSQGAETSSLLPHGHRLAPHGHSLRPYSRTYSETSTKTSKNDNDDDDAQWARQIIHEVLSGRGIDDPVPDELATKLSNRMDGVELVMYAVQRAENNARARVDAQREYGSGVDAAAQRLSDIETAANGLLIHRLRNKAKDTPAKMLRTVQAARSVGIDSWLIGAGVNAVMVSLWGEEQDAILVRHGLDPVVEPMAESQPATTAGAPASSHSPSTAIANASNGHTRPAKAGEVAEAGMAQPAAPAPTAEPTGKHLAAWNYTRNALELKHGRGTYARWLNMAKLTAAQGSHFVICMPNSYAGEWFTHRIVGDVKAGLAERLGVEPNDTDVTVVVTA